MKLLFLTVVVVRDVSCSTRNTGTDTLIVIIIIQYCVKRKGIIKHLVIYHSKLSTIDILSVFYRTEDLGIQMQKIFPTCHLS